MKQFFAVGWFCAVLLASIQLVWSADAEPAKQGPATYVGNEVCQACHSCPD